VVDRQTVQRLFHLGRSQAHVFLRRFASHTAGHALVIDREEFIHRLEELRENPGLRWEARRLHTLEEGLESVRKDLRARRTPIEVSPGSFDRQFASLPEGIRLEPGRLTVSFNTPQD
ncbi:MAG: hypothetical protein M3Z32_00675, partial [Acidobacteriota bacterium]|nr:hypothetical protein [Acidobacteriota bacterium]